MSDQMKLYEIVCRMIERMLRLLIAPTTFAVYSEQKGQNPYILPHSILQKDVKDQHDALVRVFNTAILYTLPFTKVKLPDIVFSANIGLALPRLAKPCILLPNMKYAQRKAELPFVRDMFDELGICTMPFEGKEPFEGQAELKWFDGGRKAVCGYGHRSTEKTFEELHIQFQKIYGKDNAPELLVLELISANYYHLDVAMFEYSDNSHTINACIVHKRAFSPDSIAKLKKFINNVTVIDTPDSFCLNAVIDGPNMITHTLTDHRLKDIFEETTGLTVVQTPTTEFETSGGSARCMTLDLLGVKESDIRSRCSLYTS